MKEIYDPNKRYEFPEICAACKAPCCEISPCCFIPSDFNPFSAKHLIHQIEETDYISIGYVNFVNGIFLPSPVLFLRIRRENGPIIDKETNNGKCMLLKLVGGCKLEYDKRPTGGKAVIAKPGDGVNCQELIAKMQMIKMWRKKQTTMKIVETHFLGR